MSASQPTNLTLDRALKILKSYDCVQVTNTEALVEPEQLRNSLLLITSLSSSKNLGICADDSQQGFAALASYLAALGYQINFEQENVLESSEPVYLKFNTQKMSYYLNKYTGKYRGVLVSCQSEDDLIAGTYGHFPLSLFMNSF
jgi:hypothetical protein